MLLNIVICFSQFDSNSGVLGGNESVLWQLPVKMQPTQRVGPLLSSSGCTKKLKADEKHLSFNHPMHLENSLRGLWRHKGPEGNELLGKKGLLVFVRGLWQRGQSGSKKNKNVKEWILEEVQVNFYGWPNLLPHQRHCQCQFIFGWMSINFQTWTVFIFLWSLFGRSLLNPLKDSSDAQLSKGQLQAEFACCILQNDLCRPPGHRTWTDWSEVRQIAANQRPVARPRPLVTCKAKGQENAIFPPFVLESPTGHFARTSTLGHFRN